MIWNESHRKDMFIIQYDLKLFALLFNLIYVAFMVSTQLRTMNKNLLARNQYNVVMIYSPSFLKLQFRITSLAFYLVINIIINIVLSWPTRGLLLHTNPTQHVGLIQSRHYYHFIIILWNVTCCSHDINEQFCLIWCYTTIPHSYVIQFRGKTENTTLSSQYQNIRVYFNERLIFL